MIKIVLEPARNGVIKRVIDDNHGGGREQWTSTDVFESNEDSRNKYEYIMRFFFELCEDLGLECGNKFEKDVLNYYSQLEYWKLQNVFMINFHRIWEKNKKR